MQLARLNAIPRRTPVAYDPIQTGIDLAAAEDARRKSAQDFALGRQTQEQNVIDLARNALTQKEFERTTGEAEKGRGIRSNYIINREGALDLPIGVRSPEFSQEQRPATAPFGPMGQPAQRTPMETRSIIDLARINPDMAESFRTGNITERNAVEDRGRKIGAEDTKQIADFAKAAADVKNDQDTRAETKRHNQMVEGLQRMGILAKGAGGVVKKKILPSDKVIGLADETSGLNLMKSMKGKAPKGLNPVNAWIKSINPYDTEMQGFGQYLATAKQIIGKNLEGGVLRLEDEKKYEKILPKPSDTPRTRAIKEAQLSEMLINRRNEHINSLDQAGYDVEGQELSAMDENDEAILWALKNPNDPRAKQLFNDLDKGQ